MTETRPEQRAGRGLLLFVSGPSGVGKSTVCRALTTRLPAEFALSATTRPGKPQDQWGKRYLFISPDEFRQRIEKGEFLEYANVFGHWYGTLKSPVQKSLAENKTVLLEIDVQGGRQIKAMFPDAVGIFILPPSEMSLRKRLEGRGRDDVATIKNRLAEAGLEISAARTSGAYALEVVNDVVEQTLATIENFIRQSRSRLT